jgi:hypothetical protein
MNPVHLPPSEPATPPLPGQSAAAVSERSNLVGGIILTIIGLAAIAGALRLPRAGGGPATTTYLTYAGALPLLLGITIASGGIVLACTAWRRRRDAGPRGIGFLEQLAGASRSRGAFVLGGVTAYAAVLMFQLLPFWAATYFYLAVTMVGLRAGSLRVVLLTSLGTSLGLHVLFGTVMGLPLP